MERRGMVTYIGHQSIASIEAARVELMELGIRLDLFKYSYSRGLPRRPNLLAGFAIEEARILQAVRSGVYSFAIIPGQLTRYRLLSYLLGTARDCGVEVYMYWHYCGWIMSAVRDLVGEQRFEQSVGLLDRYSPQHLVVSPSAFSDLNYEVHVPKAHCVWNAAPSPEVHQIPDDSPPLIVNVASVQLRKAPELFVDVAQYVCARHPTARFVWVGGSSDASLRAYIRSAGLDERVEFVGWSDDPGSWLRRASALLFTSRSEAFGLVVAEAMAAARTVVAFGGTGAADAIKDSGIVVPKFDAVSASEAVLAILESPVNDRINTAALQRYEQMFSPQVFARRLAGVLEGGSEVLLTARGHD